MIFNAEKEKRLSEILILFVIISENANLTKVAVGIIIFQSFFPQKKNLVWDRCYGFWMYFQTTEIVLPG